MQKHEERINYLLEKVRLSTATPEDCDELLALVDTDMHPEVLDLMIRYYEEQQLPFNQSPNDPHWKEVLQRILSVEKPYATQPASPLATPQPATAAQANGRETVSQNNRIAGANGASKTVFMKRWVRWTSVAAAIILIATGIFIWISHLTGDNNNTSPKLAQIKNDIAPGKDGATLVLEDGTEIVLDSMTEGSMLAAGAELELKPGTLAYNILTSTKTDGEVVYHTLKTSKGRQFSLELPDGSKVWLNAASSITFPVVFEKNQRRVEITGEAYFEVVPVFKADGPNAGEKIPFTVSTKKHEIQVLGTQFNVNAYSDEDDEKTTLVEGSVRIRLKRSLQELGGTPDAAESRDEVTIKPGQQAVIDKSSMQLSTLNSIDVAKVTAWRYGLFNFNDASLGEVMRQLSRWFDIDVVYENGIPKKQFWGKMSRNISLSGVLKGLEGTGVQFRIEGNKLIVVK